jgi:invasion protein IalB
VQYIVKPLVVATILASSAYAQEASQLSLGQPLLPKANIGEPYIRAENGDWAVRCVVTESGNDPCNMTQLILTEDNSPIAEISLFRVQSNPTAVAGADITVPLETLLTSPLVIRYSETNAKQYPYTFCNKIGCIARIGFSQEDVDLMKAGDRAILSITHIQQPEQAITFPMSLAGFTKSYDTLPAR